MLEVKGLSFSYPCGHRALVDVSFCLQAGEKVVLLGPNGAGKSTLLLQLTGVTRGVGSISIAGKIMARSELGELRKHVGLVFQNPDDQLFCPTVADDVAYGLRCQGLDEDMVRSKVERAIQAVRMESALERFPQNLSGGEKKRVALATVLAMEPQLLVLDEPVAGLDARARRSVIEVLKDLPTSQLIATHDLGFAREVTSRALVLDSGKLVYDGDIEALLGDSEFLLKQGLTA